MKYKQRTPNDCGPAAIAAVTGRSYESILNHWPGGWLNQTKTGGRLVPNDTPLDHFAILEALGMPYRVVSCGEILAGRCSDGKTMILVHYPESPVLKQHWVILSGTTDKLVFLDWGNGVREIFSHADFARWYSAGWPACAYVIGEGPGRLSWWQRLVARITGRYI